MNEVPSDERLGEDIKRTELALFLNMSAFLTLPLTGWRNDADLPILGTVKAENMFVAVLGITIALTTASRHCARAWIPHIASKATLPPPLVCSLTKVARANGTTAELLLGLPPTLLAICAGSMGGGFWLGLALLWLAWSPVMAFEQGVFGLWSAVRGATPRGQSLSLPARLGAAGHGLAFASMWLVFLLAFTAASTGLKASQAFPLALAVTGGACGLMAACFFPWIDRLGVALGMPATPDRELVCAIWRMRWLRRLGRL